MKINKRIGRVCAWLLACIMSVACISEEEEYGTIDLKVGETIPAFSVLMNDGRTVTEKSLKGKTSLIMFFHTGCNDCRQELPVIQKIYEDYGNKVTVICISRAEKEADIRAYWKEQELTLPYSPQEDRTVYYLFAKSGIPRVYVVNEDLVIHSIFTDNPLAEYDEIAEAIEEVLAR